MSFQGCSSKRVDREWSPWTDAPTIDNTTEWKIYQTRVVLVDFAHGGIQGEDNTENVTVWMKFVNEVKTWQQAKENCEQIGGKLFHDLDGTQTQIDLLLEKMDRADHWLGIYRDTSSVYRTVENKTIDKSLLKWRAGEPTETTEHHVGNSVVLLVNRGLNDFSEQKLLQSICDMRK